MSLLFSSRSFHSLLSLVLAFIVVKPITDIFPSFVSAKRSWLISSGRIFLTNISIFSVNVISQRSVRVQRAFELEGNAIYALRWNYRLPYYGRTQRAQNVRSGPRTNYPNLTSIIIFSREVLPKIKFLDDLSPVPLPCQPRVLN